jgi:hypothetical protein
MDYAATVAGTLTTNGQITANSAIYLKDRITLPSSSLSSASGTPAYAIYQTPGAWTHPYPDLNIIMHTGIRMAANSGYGGFRFYSDYNTLGTASAQIMSINNSADGNGAGNVYINSICNAGASLRSPIFYDSNDTSYFLNPSAAGGNSLKTIGDWRQTNDGWSGEVGGKMQYHGTNWYIQAAASFIYRNAGGSNQFYVDNTGTGVITNYLTGNNSLRSPIFYDSNNTAYYLDPASTSNVVTFRSEALGTNTSGSQNNQNGLSLYGAYTGGLPTYGMLFSGTAGLGTYGGVTATWATYFTMNTSAGRGWIFRDVNGSGNVASINNDGWAQFAASVRSPIFYDSNNTAFYLDASSTGTSLNVAGDVVGYSSSDIRYKDNVKPIENALDKIDKIKGYTFEWNELSHKQTGKKDIGVIAQEVEEILPEIIDTRDNGYKAVDYPKLTALLIQSVKEQQIIINDLKSRIEKLEL